VSSSKPKGGRPRIWTEERITADLTALLADRSEWPARRVFEAVGQLHLHMVLRRYGGIRYWRERMGFGSTPPARTWTDGLIEERLHELLVGRDRWPAAKDFDAVGARDVYMAMRVRGIPYWRTRIGLLPAARPLLWTEERVEAELRVFLAARTAWPKHQEFKANGAGRLLGALEAHGGAAYWRTRMGCRLPVRARGVGRVWTDERIAEELASFLSGRAEWPRCRDFTNEGLGALWLAIWRSGGDVHWAQRMGCNRPEAGRGA
jgi:hypothetical protein